MNVRHAYPVVVVFLACGLSACGGSDTKTDSEAKPSSTTSQSPTSSANVSPSPTPEASSEAAGGGTFSTKELPCSKFTLPEGFRLEKSMAGADYCPYSSETQALSLSFRGDDDPPLEETLAEFGEVEAPGWTHAVAKTLDDGSTGFLRYLVGGDGTVLQCTVSTGPTGTPVDASTHADFCDSAKALVYTE